MPLQCKDFVMNDENTDTYKDKSTWMRGLYMLIFMLFLGIAKFVSFAVILFQFFTVLFTSKSNPKLIKFGESLSIYHYQVMMFLTYNSEEHPFPMGDWPDQLKVSDDH